ncbi:nSTAND1 domain-containing NTPase [Nostoc sp.]|uniref:nSTAND1 domain-containing NTPase n=1 Tax=Nostoc sp. TaxID=1180 RepID=UPI002FF7AA33
MSDFQHSYALVIGINEYSNGISSLKTAVSDATKIAHLLETEHNYTVNLLIDQAANVSQLRQILEAELPKQIQTGDRFLFYFAGHGIALNGEDGPEGYLVPQNAKFGNVSTYLPMSELNKALLQLSCSHFLGILDCCFAGAFRWSSTRKLIPVELSTLHKERYDRFIQDPAWQVITSAAYDQTALDAFDLKDDRGEIGVHSPFACALIEGLQGKADAFPPAESGKPAGDGVITATELYLYLRDRVEIATQARAIRQTPGISCLNKHDKGEYIFLTPGHELNLPPAPPLDVSKNPYRGLSPFEEEHCNLFFGRNALTQKLYEFVISHTLTVVLGASGSGKSSLVKAGLIPKLRQCKDGNTWFILPPFRPGESPFKTLNNALALVNLPAIATPNEVKFSALLTPAQSLAEWFKEHHKANLVLVIDQFEELITLCRNDQERQQFLEALVGAIATYPHQLHLVLTLRSDFEPQFHNTVLQKDWQTARFVVPAMTREELRQAIEEPASARVMYFEPHELVDQLIDEVANMPGALPLLSFGLSELYLKYLKRQEDAKIGGETIDRAITQADYEELGGVTRSLTQRADQEYETLVKQDPAYAQTIQYVMLRMVAVGGELARRRVPLSELKYPEIENIRVLEVIQRFAAARLLVSGIDVDGNSYVEPAHDALIRGWQKLLIWKKEQQENLTLQRRLTPAAEEWDKKRETRFLWNANPYLKVLQKQVLNSLHNNWLNQVETEFLQRSVKQKRWNICMRWGFVTGAFLLLSGATVIAIKNGMDAQNNSLESSSALAESLFVSGKELNALVEATKTGYQLKKLEKTFLIKNFFVTEDTKFRVLTTLQQVVYGLRERNYWLDEGGVPTSVSFSPDGRMLVSTSIDKTIKLWRANGELIQTLPKQNSRVFSVSFSSNSQTLISASRREGVKFWQRQPDGSFSFQKSILVQEKMIGLSLSPKNKMIATASLNSENTIKLWSWDGKFLATFLGHTDPINDLNFSPDGQMLVSVSGDMTIKLWSLKKSKLYKNIQEKNKVVKVRFIDNQTIVYALDDGTIKFRKVSGESTNFQERHSGVIERLALSPDGKILASASVDRTVKLWSLKNGRLLQTLKGHESAVTDVSFSPNSKMIVSASNDRSIRIWKLDNQMPTIQGSSLSFSPDSQMIATGQGKKIKLWYQNGKLQKVFPEGHRLPITKISFAPNGKLIASGSGDGIVKLWYLDGRLFATLKGHRNLVTSVSFSPSGKIIATASRDRTVKLWGLDGTLLKTFNVGSVITSISFSPNGEIIAASCEDMTVKLWHLDDRLNETSLPPLTGHKASVLDVSFSPNGKIIASASEDGNVILWHLNGQRIVVLHGHRDSIYRVKFSPSGQTLVSASRDNTIKLWNLNGDLLRTLEGHQEKFFDISFSPDGTILASANDNEEVILRNLNIDHLLEDSCNWLHDYLILLRKYNSTSSQDSSSKFCN